MAAPRADSIPSGGTTCILWTGPSGQTPGPLAEIVARQQLPLEVATDRFGAIAAACLAARSGRVVIILDEPARLEGRQELLAAIDAYLPEARLWAYDPAREPPLGALLPDRPPNRSPGEPVQREGQRAEGLPLRLVGAGATGAPPADEEPPRANLSAEELEMLLQDDDE